MKNKPASSDNFTLQMQSRKLVTPLRLCVQSDRRNRKRGLLAGVPAFAAIFLGCTVPLWAAEPDKKEAGTDLPTLLFVFMLASFIGLGVITRVSRLLHTPLMS